MEADNDDGGGRVLYPNAAGLGRSLFQIQGVPVSAARHGSLEAPAVTFAGVSHGLTRAPGPEVNGDVGYFYACRPDIHGRCGLGDLRRGMLLFSWVPPRGGAAGDDPRGLSLCVLDLFRLNALLLRAEVSRQRRNPPPLPAKEPPLPGPWGSAAELLGEFRLAGVLDAEVPFASDERSAARDAGRVCRLVCWGRARALDAWASDARGQCDALWLLAVRVWVDVDPSEKVLAWQLVPRAYAFRHRPDPEELIWKDAAGAEHRGRALFVGMLGDNLGDKATRDGTVEVFVRLF